MRYIIGVPLRHKERVSEVHIRDVKGISTELVDALQEEVLGLDVDTVAGARAYAILVQGTALLMLLREDVVTGMVVNALAVECEVIASEDE